MKLDAVRGNRDVESSSEDQIEYGIDGSQMWLLYNVLSQYSNPVASIVRELATNAFDSHIEAGQDKRISVRIIEENILTNESSRFEVEDYGTGLSPERIKNIYSKFLASTKRDSNAEHGAFGLGSKSPFSYTDMFYMTTIYEGIEYFYAMHKGTNTPRIDLLSKEPTTQSNGTKVTINIDVGDLHKFKREAKRQLAYFDNINHEGTGVDNDYRIFEGEHFIYREHAEDLGLNRLHICLGKVYYPIDFSAVSLERKNSRTYTSNLDIHTPIGLKFEIGDLPIMWSRENIEYTNEAIEIIQEKYHKAQEEFQELYDSKADSVETIKEYFNLKLHSKSNKLELVEGVEIPYINHMIEQEATLDTYSDLNNLPRPENVASLVYKVHKKVSKGIAHSLTSTFEKSVANRVYNGSEIRTGLPIRGSCYLLKSAYNTRKNKYLYEEQDESIFYLVSKKSDSEKPSQAEILTTFGYDEDSFDDVDDSIVDLIKKYTRESIELLLNSLESYEDVDVPEDFSSTPSGKTREDIYDPSSDNYNPNLKIHFKSVKINTSSYYHSNAIDGFTVYEPTIKFLQDHSRQLRIYGFQEDSDTLEDIGVLLYKCYSSSFFSSWKEMPDPERFMILKIAKNKEDVLMDLSDNAIHVDDFINKRHKVLVRELTYYYIGNVLESKNSMPLKRINTSSLSLIEDLKMRDYYTTVKKGCRITNAIAFKGLTDSRTHIPETLNFILESPAFLNQKILREYNEAVSYVNKYPLLYSLLTDGIDDDKKELLTQELKYYLKGKDQINPVLKQRLEEKKRKEDLTELDRILETLNI